MTSSKTRSTRFAENDPRIIWVGPGDGGGTGTFSDPFRDMSKALDRVQPGETIVLREGAYLDDVTIQKSGTLEHPVTIVGQPGAHVRVMGSCWYLYDVSDVIVSGISFISSPLGSISIVGSCRRNRFENLAFIDCGGGKEAACTLFFGGSGGGCNIVENCRFERSVAPLAASHGDALIGLMVSGGNAQSGEPIRNHVFRRNRFVNYQYAILVGSGDRVEGEFGHVVEYNTIESCTLGGILVKCGDTMVRGNTLSRCGSNSIYLLGGRGSMVENNRIVDGATGICVAGEAHTIQENCLIRCKEQGIRIPPVAGEGEKSAENIFVERNTFVQCGPEHSRNGTVAASAAILMDNAATCVVRRNLFHGQGIPYLIEQGAGPAPRRRRGPTNFVSDNLCSGGGDQIQGCQTAEVTFAGSDQDDYENLSGYGATGWVTKPQPYDPDESGDESEAQVEMNEIVEGACSETSDSGRGDTVDRSLFFGRERG